MPIRGFVLTPVSTIVDTHPEVRLYGILETGEPTLIVDDRTTPYFFVRAVDRATVAEVAPRAHCVATDLRAFDGAPVLRVEVALPGDVPSLRRRLAEAGVRAFEADVRFAQRLLIDRDIRGSFAVDGPFETHPRLGRIYRNPMLVAADWVPTLRLLSLDIETTMNAGRIHSIAVAGAGGEKVWLVYDRPVAGAEVVPDERACVAAFLEHVRVADPDVITGWNVVDFDLAVIQQACRRGRLACALGRADAELEIPRDERFGRDLRAVLDGRIVLDGLALLRGSYIRLDDYRLETAARTLLGRGKLVAGENRGEEVQTLYRENPAHLVAYNLEDARLVLDILSTTGLVALTVARSRQTGMPLDRVSAQIAAVDSLYLRALRAAGRVAPSVEHADAAPIAGGLVLDAVPGFHRNILVFDFKSLYPSLIRTFNLDPLTWVPVAPDGVAVQATPGGQLFRRDEPGILPALVERLWAERAEARAAGDAVAAQATKILMNSLFGVLGSPASRLFSPPVANAITLAGQHVIRRAAEAVRALGHRVVYGDTDSLFVDAAEPDAARAEVRGAELCDAIGARVASALEQDFGCTSRLELEFEKVYARLFLPEVRGGAVGSKKRYAGLVGARLEIIGLEAVRRDWSWVARRFQRELFRRVFHDEPVVEWMAGYVADLRAGAFDADLVYRKALRKKLDAYTKTTPPHVQAARKSGVGIGAQVSYVVTKAGPEPVDAMTAPPDYAHYVTHQLQPIADAVLGFLGGPDFDDVIGAPKQLGLFR